MKPQIGRASGAAKRPRGLWGSNGSLGGPQGELAGRDRELGARPRGSWKSLRGSKDSLGGPKGDLAGPEDFKFRHRRRKITPYSVDADVKSACRYRRALAGRGLLGILRGLGLPGKAWEGLIRLGRIILRGKREN